MYTREELEAKSESELAAICGDLDPKFNPEMASVASMIELILDNPLGVVVKKKPPRARATKPKVEAAEPAIKVQVETKPKRKRLIIHNQEGTDSSPFVKVGVNGTMYQIARETEVTVPYEVIHVLENAVITRDERGPDGHMVERHARRFPFTVLGDA